MTSVLEIIQISPHTKYEFKNNGDYKLVFIQPSQTIGKTNIYVIPLEKIGNISDQVRGYTIDKKISLDESAKLTIMLVKSINNKITLLYHTVIDFMNDNNKSPVLLEKPPPTIKNQLRTLTYEGLITYLSEPFHRWEKPIKNRSNVLLFLQLKSLTNNESNIISPEVVNINDYYIPIFDRDVGFIMNEWVPHNYRLTSGTHVDKHYYHIKKISNKCDKSNNILIYQLDPINVPYRQHESDEYVNNLLTAPIDGRTRGFEITMNTLFNIYDNNYKLRNLINENLTKKFIGGSGIITRMTPYDSQFISVPFGGNLIQTIRTKYSSAYIFRNDYFIPSNVGERDIASIIYGNFFYTGAGVGAGNRAYPELLRPQPNVGLTFAVIVFGNPTMTHSALDGSRNASRNQKHAKWISPNEILGNYSCNDGTVIILCDRHITFYADIDTFSGVTNSGITKTSERIDVRLKRGSAFGLIN